MSRNGNGWGGRRAGSGAPTKPLMHHIFNVSFRAHRHAQLLDDYDSLLELKFEQDDPDAGYLCGLYDIQNAYREADTVRRRAVIATVFEKGAPDWVRPSARRPAPPFVPAHD